MPEPFAKVYIAELPLARGASAELWSRLKWEMAGLLGLLAIGFTFSFSIAFSEEKSALVRSLPTAIVQALAYLALFVSIKPYQITGFLPAWRVICFPIACIFADTLLALASLQITETLSSALAPEIGSALGYPATAFDDDLSMTAIFGGQLSTLIFVSGVALFVLRRADLFARHRAASSLVAVDPSKLPALDDALHEITEGAKRAGLPVRIPPIWLDRASPSVTPSIIAEKEDAHASHLLIPRGFVVLLARQPAVARSILGHELSHVVQGDANIWAFNDLVSTLIMRGIVPMIVLTTALKLLMALAMVGSIRNVAAFFPLVACVRLNMVHRALGTARRNSELLADRYGAVVTDPASLIEAIESFSIDGSPTHPQRAERIGVLKAMIPPRPNE